MSLKERIIALRGELEREAFAEKVGVSKSTIARWEQGRGTPKGGELARIAKEFNVNIHWLLTGETGPPVREETAIYKDREEPRPYLNDTPEWVAELLRKARQVLQSGNKAASDALEKNIEYFSKAVDIESKQESLEAEKQRISDRMGKLEDICDLVMKKVQEIEKHITRQDDKGQEKVEEDVLPEAAENK
jgi:transcriptional regulator with XRE-family HTH domain